MRRDTVLPAPEEDRVTTLPASGLVRAMTTREAEDEVEVEELGPPDVWLEHWCRFVGRFDPGDELWTYAMPATADADAGDMVGALSRLGYARVRDGLVLDFISGIPWR